MKIIILAGLFSLLFSLPLLAQEQSLQVEERVPNNRGVNPFNYDNVIFAKNKTYVYDYFIVKGADKFKYKIISDSSGKKLWSYVPVTSIDSAAVCYLGLKTLDKIGPIMVDKPAYNQTEVFLYHYNTKLSPLDTELTGLIENKKNVWLHPFRFNALEILQLSPFPYIKLPYQKGQTYSWNLAVGEKWPEFKSFDWKGSLSLKCNYTVKGKEALALPFGKVQTIKVEAIASTAVGTSSLVSYFNEQYGFVKLVYRNIDNSQVIITLRAVNQ